MDPFLGEIRLFSFQNIPKGWHACDGTLLPIQQNSALFALLGTMYGGNGVNNFALPDLRGRVPIHASQTIPQGTKDGTESVTLVQANLPPHPHIVSAFTAAGNTGGVLNNWPASDNIPGNVTPAPAPAPNLYVQSPGSLVPLDPSSVSSTGNSGSHENRQPSMALNYCIAVTGLFPPRN